MPLPEKQLFIKQSSIGNAGKGLFTKQYIAKGTRIIEYKGRVTTWKKVLERLWQDMPMMQTDLEK
jgi:uncharacterized protein